MATLTGAVPVISSAEHRVLPTITSQILNGSGLAEVRTVSLISRNSLADATLQPVSDSQLGIALPLAQTGRDAYLFVQTADAAVVAFDSASAASRVISAGGDVTITGASPYELVYVKSGGKLRLSGVISGLASAVAVHPGLGFFRAGHPIHFTVVGSGGVTTAPSTTYSPDFESVALTAMPAPGAFFQG